MRHSHQWREVSPATKEYQDEIVTTMMKIEDVSSSLNHAVIQVSCIDQPLSLVDVKVTLVQNHKIDSLLTSGILVNHRS